MTDKVVSGGEQGLLGLAFDPDFETNGMFYVNYTSSDSTQLGNTIVARYQVANASADVANVIKVTPIITIDQPQSKSQWRRLALWTGWLSLHRHGRWRKFQR